MNLQTIRGKKPLKLLMILLCSLAIASVSAGVYNSMFMNATVGAVSNLVQFTSGTDTSVTGGTISASGQTVTFTHMDGTIGTGKTYTDPVNIANLDSASHVISLNLNSWTGTSSTPMNNITISMYNGATKMGSSIVLIPGGGGSEVDTTGNQTIVGSGVWSVQWSIYWTNSATSSNSVYVSLLLKVW